MIRTNQRRLSITISSIVLNVDRNPPSIIHKIYQDAKYLSLFVSVQFSPAVMAIQRTAWWLQEGRGAGSGEIGIGGSSEQ